jgi:hypothetical protein
MLVGKKSCYLSRGVEVMLAVFQALIAKRAQKLQWWAPEKYVAVRLTNGSDCMTNGNGLLHIRLQIPANIICRAASDVCFASPLMNRGCKAT